jgi:hypothetical protein
MITLTGTRRTLGKITWQKSTSLWRTSHEKPALRNIALSELLSQNEVLMKRLPSNLSADDLRTCRRWTGGLYQSIERNPDGAPERLINIHRWSGSRQACHQAVAALG